MRTKKGGIPIKISTFKTISYYLVVEVTLALTIPTLFDGYILPLSKQTIFDCLNNNLYKIYSFDNICLDK